MKTSENKMMTGNKGEWSEVYTLLKIISDKKIYAGDIYLNKIEDLIFPIIKVLRSESNGTFEFSYDNDLVIIRNNQYETLRIPITEFKDNASILLSYLKEKQSSSFAIQQIEEFINSFNCRSIKAKSSVKTDIRVILYDEKTGTTPNLGFSIKSKLGGSSTLLNASKSTNFIFKIKNIELSDSQISEINLINTRSKIKDRLRKINQMGGCLKFDTIQDQNFEDNLTIIDSAMPQIFAEILLLFFTSNHSKISDLVDIVTNINPMNYNIKGNSSFYSYKVKRLLTDVALGMMPSKPWKGKLDATGGYLVVKENGDVLCYHIYKRNEFEDYLFVNTKLETPSSSRHDFGQIYKLNNQLYFNLNLQIRFI